MNILAIDTTSTGLSIALVKNGEMFSYTKEIGKSGHSATLMPSVKAMLDEHEVDVNDIDVIGVVVGPGSFTGIRIGVSAMTALAFATGAKRIAITAFELIAYNRRDCIAGVDAGHGNLYLAECKNGKVVKQSFVENGQKDCLDAEKIDFKPLASVDETLAKVAIRKANDKEFVSVFEPFYMRKSQAEREKDEV